LEKNPSTEEEILLKRIEQSDLEKGINPKIILLRQKLAQKAKRQPKFRFYSLYSLICRKDVLNVAWERVYANGGSHGVDNVTFEDIIKTNGATKLIEEIHEDLVNKTYKPRAVRRVYIPKADGSERPLGIPTIKDRIVQMAALLVEFIRAKLEDWMGLVINKEKTKVVKLTGEKTSIDFLGFNMRFAPSTFRKGDKYFTMTPKKQVMRRARERIRELTDRKLNCLPIKQLADKWISSWMERLLLNRASV
jgi:hypothetical protein